MVTDIFSNLASPPAILVLLRSCIYHQWLLNVSKDIFEAAEIGFIVSLTAILRLLQRKNSTFLFVVLLLLNERGLNPESCLAIFHPKASCL